MHELDREVESIIYKDNMELSNDQNALSAARDSTFEHCWPKTTQPMLTSVASKCSANQLHRIKDDARWLCTQ